MNYIIEYTKYPEGNYEHLSMALNENNANIAWDGLSDLQKHLLENVKDNPHYIPVRLTEIQALNELAAKTTSMWPQHKNIRTFFLNGSTFMKEKTLEYASEWSNYCNIRFELAHDRTSSDIRIAYNKTGNWSYIGTDALTVSKNQATVNFEYDDKDVDLPEFRGTVLHEFGHVLGLIHEHQSPAIVINWNKGYIYNYCQFGYGWDKATVDLNFFAQFDKKDIRHTVGDPHSIMAYYIPTSFTLDGQSFPKNLQLSTLDKQFIGELYPKSTFLYG